MTWREQVEFWLFNVTTNFQRCFNVVVPAGFVPFLLAIVLSVLLRYTDSYYSFGIFKLLLLTQQIVQNRGTTFKKRFRLLLALEI